MKKSFWPVLALFLAWPGVPPANAETPSLRLTAPA